MKTRPLETAEAVLQVYRSQASDRASAMPQVGGCRRCLWCRERMAGRVCRASSGEGLLEVPSLAWVKDQKLTIPKLMHMVIRMITQALTSRYKLTLIPKEVEDRRTLTRVHLILPKLATVYPIPATNPSHMPTTQEENRVVEAREVERTMRW
jgi:hypothetical protein